VQVFLLTTQERAVVFGFCFILFSGLLIDTGLKKDWRVFRWIQTSQKHPLLPLVDINRAGAEELLRIPGIGPKTAQFIMEYRQRHGPLKDLWILKKARGMTPERYERIVPYFKL
jgi:competence ComEA-like helix-hairpin-helix protein